MRKLHIHRIKEIKDGTIGEFALIEDLKIILKGYTLEPAGPDTTEPNQDRRIPNGEYQAEFFNSPRYGRRLPLLWNDKVSKERKILIHHGNYPKDTLGCILVGDSYDEKGIFNSRKTLKRLLELLDYTPFEIVIKNKL